MDDLISDFLAETNESLSKLDVELVKLEQNPEDKDLLSSIFRIMHTIKGTCGFLGLGKLESVAHAGENILGKIRDNEIKVTPHNISLVLKSIDTIKSLLEYLEANGSEPDTDVSGLIADLNKAAAGEGGSAAATDAPAKAPEEVKPVENKTEEAPKEEEKADASKPSFKDVIGDIEKLMTNKNQELAQQFMESIGTTEKTETTISNTDSHSAPSVPAKKAVASPAAKKAPAANAKDNKANSHQTIRVNVEVLEGMMQVVSELVLTRNQLVQLARANKDSEFNLPLQRLNHITSELQEKVMKTRMQPIGNAWSQFPRVIRDLSIELNKKIDLVMIGEETELDRQLIESIKDPFTHMVRNSADHGIEVPEERRKAGKPETGTVTLKAYHQGGHIIVEISDDGKGLPIEKIKAKAIANGLASEEELEVMSDQQIYQYIFRAGFSTAEKVTAVSGRGVGMDVVKTNIEKISGTIELRSVVGQGSTFVIKIPLTLAIMPILIVDCNGCKFGIPQIAIIEMVKTGKGSEHKIEYVDSRLILRLRNTLLPLIVLKNILYPHEDYKIEPDKKYHVVVCEVGSFTYGIIVDKIYDTEEIVVKPVAPILKSIEVFSGSTLLGDGNVIMILDPNGLVDSFTSKTGGKSNNSYIGRDRNLKISNQHTTNFLLFKAGSGALKAVPLDLISRLEEIDVSKIEVSVNKQVIQYRNALMHIVQINDEYKLDPNNQVQQIIVFSEKDKIIGLAIEEILDIVENSVDGLDPANKEGYVGSLIINNQTVDVIDLRYFFKQAFDIHDSNEGYIAAGSKPKLLLVDDSPFFRKFIPPSLEKICTEVLVAENVKEGLKLLDQHKDIDIIVTDINMPETNGIEFVKICKSDDKLKHIPVIALSSNNDTKLIDDPKSVGFEAFVSKTNHDDIFKVISNIVSKVSD